MLLRITSIFECWCDECHEGMSSQLLEITFAADKSLHEHIDQPISCKHCGHENNLEDVFYLYPEMFSVRSAKDINKMKTDKSLSDFLNS